ncbi:MAG: hypothetical protein NXI09_05995 [Bacteroidetes bacterium]|nr:hypothetical protein [Bacteroidota bacterium]
MKRTMKIGLSGLMSLALLGACSSEDDATDTASTNAQLNMNFTGLEDLGADYNYEGWIIVDGSPISAGIFSVDADGNPSQTSFSLNADDLAAASTYVLTIEPSPDPDPSPSSVHILAGDFSSDMASLNTAHAAAIGSDFTSASGSFILATPTDGGSMTDELSGIWWLDPAGPSAGLELPVLAEGWAYEGWVVINGQALSTGTFTSASGSDEAATYSGTMAGPPFPGEDFLLNAPQGLSFPTDLSGTTAVISIEPVPDNSPAPFTLKPLVASIPAGAMDHTPYSMDNNAANTNPSGVVSR